MSMLTIRPSVLHRRKLLDCKPRAPNFPYWEIDTTLYPYPYDSTSSNIEKLFNPAPSRNLSCTGRPFALKNKFAGPSPTKANQSSTVSPWGSPSSEIYESMLQLNQSPEASIEPLRGKGLALNVQGINVNSKKTHINYNGYLQRSINSVKLTNDTYAYSTKCFAKEESLSTSSPESGFSNHEHFLPTLEDKNNVVHGSSSCNQPVYTKAVTAAEDAIPQCASSAGLSGDRSRSVFEENVQTQIDDEKDNKLIKEIRQMLRQSMTRSVYPDNQIESYSNTQTRITIPPHSENPDFKSKQKFQQTSNDGLKHGSAAGHNEKGMMALEGNYSNDGRTNGIRVSLQHTHFDEEGKKLDTVDNKNICWSQRKSTDVKTDQPSPDKMGNQGKRVSFVEDDPSKTTNDDVNYPQRRTPFRRRSTPSYRHKGLELIDKIKTTQHRLASVRVKSPLQSSSQEEVTEEKKACAIQRQQASCGKTNSCLIWRHQLSRGKADSCGKTISCDKTDSCNKTDSCLSRGKTDSRGRMLASSQPPSKMTFDSIRMKSPPKFAEKLAVGDYSDQTFQGMVESRFQSKLVGRSNGRGGVAKTDKDERILCWLKSVEPLVRKERARYARAGYSRAGKTESDKRPTAWTDLARDRANRSRPECSSS
ncbi:hypothetical protein EGW08_011627, partial [Elysia chlorotica]